MLASLEAVTVNDYVAMTRDGYIFDWKLTVTARYLNTRPNGQVRGATLVIENAF